jgi:uncharacterized protein (TIGR02996 family)
MSHGLMAGLINDGVFLEAILAEPDDDASRLVYADWLEEEGGPGEHARAELIRVQVRAERLPVGRERSALLKRARYLIKAHPEWAEAITKRRLGSKVVFQRGFPHRVTCHAYRFVRVADELFAAAPTIRSVIFPTPLNEIEDLVACPALARLSEADLSQFCMCGTCSIDLQILAVFSCPYFQGLTRLTIRGNRISVEGARALASSSAFPSLRHLDLSENALGNEGALALLESPWMNQLERLNLRDNAIGARAASALRQQFGRAVLL